MQMKITYYPKTLSTESRVVEVYGDVITIRSALEYIGASEQHKKVYVNDEIVDDYTRVLNESDIVTILEHLEGDSVNDFMDGVLMVAGAIAMGGAMMMGFGIPGFLLLVAGSSMLAYGASDYIKRNLVPDVDTGVKSSVKDRPDVYGGKNSIKADAPIPIVLGKTLVTPYVVGDYWSEATDGDDGNDMYIHALLCVGYGPLLLEKFKLGDCDLGVSMSDPRVSGDFAQILRPSSETSPYLSTEDDIVIGVRQGYPVASGSSWGSKGSPYATSIYDKRVREEMFNVEIVWEYEVSQTDYFKMTPARMTARSLTKDIEGNHTYTVGAIVSAQGFVHYNEDGDASAYPVTLQMMWRTPGTEIWQPFASATASVTVNNMSKDKEVRYNLRAQYKGPSAQIEVTIVRSRPNCVNGHNGNHSNTATHDSYLDKWVWLTLRTHTEDPVFPDQRVARQLCLVALRAKASKNVSGSLDALNCVATSMLPSLNTSTGLWPLTKPDPLNPNAVWSSWTPTSNPADHYLAMFLGVFAPTSSINLAQCQSNGTRFSWDKLRDLYTWCNESRTITLSNGSTKRTKNCEYNRYVTNAMKLKDMLDSILKYARAQYITEGTRYSLIHDAVYNKYSGYTTRYRNPYNQIVPKALITPRNGKDFAVSKEFKQTPDAIKVSINSAAAGYVPQQIVIRNPRLTQAELNAKIVAGTALFEEATYEGITDAYIATMYTWYRFGVYIHRRVTCTLSTDIEHLFYAVGDRVSAATDVLLTGYSYGRVINYAEDATGYILALDDAIEYPDGTALGIVVWSMSNGNVLPIACTAVDPVDRGDGVLMTSVVRTNSKSSDIAESIGEDLYYSIGPIGSETKPWLVVAKELAEDDRAKLTLVECSPEVHNSDDGTIEEYKFDTSAIKGHSISALAPAATQVPSPDPFGTIGGIVGRVNVIENGDELTVPDSVTYVTVRASQEGVKATWVWSPASSRALANNLSRFVVEVSRNAGADWPVTDYTLTNEYTYKFDKAIDGLPSAADLLNYRVRVKAENAYGKTSAEFAPSASGGVVDTAGYAGWVPEVPSIGFRVSNRTVTVNFVTSADWYGKGPFDIQIAKGYTVKPNGEIETITDTGSLVWYAPALGVDPYASYENYREGDIDGFASRTGTSITLVLPLYGQNENPEVARDTPYYFRIRGTTFVDGEKTTSEWCSPSLTVATATTAKDLVRAWSLTDAGTRVKVDGAIGAQQIYAEFLSAITANLGLVTDGAFRGNENNMWALTTMEVEGHTVYEGTVRMGGTNQYLRIEPRVSNGVLTGEYDIDFKVGNFTVTAVGSTINGVFEVRNTSDNIVYFSVDPVNNGIVAVKSMLRIGDIQSVQDRVTVKEDYGVSSVVFSGSGENGIEVLKEGSVSANITVEISDTRIIENLAEKVGVYVDKSVYAVLQSGDNVVITFLEGSYMAAVSHDAGETFTYIPNKGNLRMIGGGTVLPNGYFILEASGSYTARSTDGGYTWEELTPYGEASYGITAVGNKLYRVTNSGVLIVSEDFGSTYNTVPGSIACNTLWSCGESLYATLYSNPRSLYVLENGVWSLVYTGSSAPKLSTIVSDGTSTYMLNADGTVYVRTSGAFTVHGSNAPTSVAVMQFFDGVFVVTKTDGSVYTSEDAILFVKRISAVTGDSGTSCQVLKGCEKFYIPTYKRLYVGPKCDREKYRWKNEGGQWTTTYKVYSGRSVLLTGFGIEFAFTAGSGHIAGSSWNIKQGAIGGLSVRDSSGVENFSVRNGVVKCGLVDGSSKLAYKVPVTQAANIYSTESGAIWLSSS